MRRAPASLNQRADPMDPDLEQSHEPYREGSFAAFIRKLGELLEAREAANPTHQPPPEPSANKPGSLIAAEKDLLRWELIERVQPHLCGGPEKCKHGRCRRARRCGELEGLKGEIEAARATLARERAQWNPEAPPASERRRSRRGSGRLSP